MKAIPQALLRDYTTFQLGGPCRLLMNCETPEELQKAVKSLSKDKTHFILIGSGSNLVISDNGLKAAVIRYVSTAPLIERDGNDVVVAASTILDDLVLYCVDESLEGLNYATGIPGTVGGAVVGNAGAWGKQVGDVLKSAVILDKKGNLKEVKNSYFGFQYRHSRLKETNDIISSVRFTLKAGDPVALAQKRAEILKIRAEKHPDLKTEPCAGSFFRNIEPTSKAGKRQAAGWFLEQAGAKDLRVGGAYIFKKHANIIIKGPRCTSKDVYDLHLKMIEIVKDKFSLQLNREVRFVGPFHSAETKKEEFW
ncbi:MAG: UDP-N-acetylmuramate dehydrogenase [Candidatus Omnitrophica bacterium]|nr:UDP-N-acetylmuramate dehydrogenase [Candidatus Omnitrophota bacterium]